MTRASRRFQVLVYLVHRGSGSCGTRIFMAAKRTSPFWISKNRIGVPLIRRSYVFIVRTCHRRHDTYARAGSKSLTRSGECTFDWPLGRQVRKGLFCAKRTFSIYIYIYFQIFKLRPTTRSLLDCFLTTDLSHPWTIFSSLHHLHHLGPLCCVVLVKSTGRLVTAFLAPP